MKTLALLVSAGVLALATGCSSLVALSGKDVGSIACLEQAHAEFGKPVAVGTADGRDYEDFNSHKKIADPQRAGVLIMGDLMSCGLMEFVLFPYEMACFGKTAISGGTVRFFYDSSGNITDVYANGEQVALRANAGRTMEAAGK
jgi:hypothetical protein